MSGGKAFNFGSITQTASGQGSVNQIGDNTATVNITAGGSQSVEYVFKTILEAVPEPERSKINEEAVEPIEEQVELLKAMPPEEASKPEIQATFVSRVTELVAPLAPYADKISAALIGFTETGLSLVPPPAGWAIACTLAAIKAAKTTAAS